MNKKIAHPELEHSEVIDAIPLACADETAAVEFFEKLRWGTGPRCPHCERERVYKIQDRDGTRNKRYLWRCRLCGEQFTVRIGTILEDSRLPLRHWAYAFWRASTSKKGVSAREIERHCQISYKTALFLLHRIRYAVSPEGQGPKFLGTVEVDETWVGGKKKKHEKENKIPVVAMLERGGQVRTKVVPNVTSKNLKTFINSVIAPGAIINTDESVVYPTMLKPLTKPSTGGYHHRVVHSRKEYARTDPDGSVAHVNTAESFFSLLKRGLTGTFHAVSKEHLHRYCAEFAFRWNGRKLSDGERLALAIRTSVGRRLEYKDAVA